MKANEINKDVRLIGSFLKLFSSVKDESALKRTAAMSAKIMGKWDIASLNGKKTFITRKDGSRMKVCIYNGKKSEGGTVGILWLHGGGYALGSPEMVKMSFAKQLLLNKNCVIVAPDYTLSVFAPYPAAIMDSITALQWMKRNREKLGIDCDSFVIGGESAGGGLAAAAALFARDKGIADICLQIPLYPMIDDRDTDTSANNTAPVWNTSLNHAAWKVYLGDLYGTDKTGRYAAPARASELSGLPPAISFVGTIEPFYAETVRYFRRLEQAGVPTELMTADGCFHAFDMLVPLAGISKKAVKFALAAYDKFVEQI